MDIDILRNDLREFQHSVYVDEDNVILSHFFSVEKNITKLELKNGEVKNVLKELKNEIFKTEITKSTLFNCTVKLDILLETISIEYHKK